MGDSWFEVEASAGTEVGGACPKKEAGEQRLRVNRLPVVMGLCAVFLMVMMAFVTTYIYRQPADNYQFQEISSHGAILVGAEPIQKPIFATKEEINLHNMVKSVIGEVRAEGKAEEDRCTAKLADKIECEEGALLCTQIKTSSSVETLQKLATLLKQEEKEPMEYIVRIQVTASSSAQASEPVEEASEPVKEASEPVK